MDKWDHFRRYITVRARMQFIKHLSTRGYSGKLTFNHEKKRLDIRVQTEEGNTQATQKQQKDSFKDAKSLSGGPYSLMMHRLAVAHLYDDRREEFLNSVSLAYLVGIYRLPDPCSRRV